MRYTVFALLVALGTGCVPVTRPVGDIEKAEPDKALVGEWTVSKTKGSVAALTPQEWAVDVPEVKGNPKGLMRMGGNDGTWFFISTAGKHTYANLIVGAKAGDDVPKFGTEGAFAKWNKEAAKHYYVFRYSLAADTLGVDSGDVDGFAKLMAAEKIAGDGGKHLQFFDTPAGWLAKYLDKNGSDKVFAGANVATFTRAKAKK